MVDRRSLPGARTREQFLDHRERALVVMKHELQEETVELGVARLRKPRHLPGREHPRHEFAHPAVPPVARRAAGRLLAPVAKPAPHEGDLVLLRDLDAQGQPVQQGVGRAVPEQRGHFQRLGVVGDHPPHEAKVGVRVGRKFGAVEFARVQHAGVLPGRSGLNRGRRGLRGEGSERCGPRGPRAASPRGIPGLARPGVAPARLAGG